MSVTEVVPVIFLGNRTYRPTLIKLF